VPDVGYVNRENVSSFEKFNYISANQSVNIKLSLYLTKHHAMKTYWGVEE
jgi:hypothetical protein